MKRSHLLCILSSVILLFSACSEDEVPSLTGTAVITIENESLFNTDNYFVEASIVLAESDQGVLINFSRWDISNGSEVTFSPVTLNAGNYYVRHQYYLENSPSGSLRHKPFQIQAGKEVEVRIIR